MKKIFNELIWLDYVLTSIFLITIIVRIFCPNLLQQKGFLNHYNIPILIKIDSLSESKYFSVEHNSTLINSLQQKVQSQQDGIIALENNEVEARNFYTVILLGILSIVFSNLEKNFRTYIIILGLAFIFIMYFVDIHYKDMKERSNYTKNIQKENIDALVNSYPNNKSWYELNYVKLNTYVYKVSEFNKRIPRKIKDLFRPDLPQIVFYIFPWIVLYVLGRYSKVKYG
jgi:hypothetical protein